MLKQLSQRPVALSSFLTVLVSVLAAILIGMRIGSTPLTFQDLIMGAAVIAIVIIFIQKRGLEIGFIIWVGAFALGYRVIHLSAPLILDQFANNGKVSQEYLITGKPLVIDIHPLFIMIYLLLGLLLLRRAINWQIRVVWLIPGILMVFSVFWIWGWTRGTELGRNWVDMFSEVMPFLILPPIFIVTASVLQKQSLWKPTFLVLILVGTFISFMGLLEFLFPSIGHVIPGFVTSDQTSYIAQGGFQRANFTFWGQTGAAFIVALTMPTIIPLWSWYKQSRWRGFLLVCLVMEAIGLYIAGWRSIWMSMILITIGLLLLRGNWIRALFLVIALTVVYSVLPPVTQKRVESLFNAIQGNFQDNSAADRAGRTQAAITKIIENPLGLGWNGYEWVHDDFLQITANLGIIAGILFALWYLTTLIRISRAFYQNPDPLKHGLVGIFMVCGMLLLTQPMIELTQYTAPVWFAWALVKTKLRQVNEQKQNYEQNQTNGAYTNIQLPKSPARMPGIGEMG